MRRDHPEQEAATRPLRRAGPILLEAHRLEAEGHKILKLNIGNTAPFGFEAPEAILVDMVQNLPESQGYSDSRGIYSARTAVAQYYQSCGLPRRPGRRLHRQRRLRADLDGPQAFVDDGNEVLVPAPDYPLWTGAVALTGGAPVHYRCDEDNGWNPDLEDIESKITERTYAIVVINPNNPTGAVYCEDIVKGLVDIARRHQLVVMADEIYEKIIFDDAQAPPRGDLRRRRRPLPHLQRAVQGLPGMRVPLRVGDGLRAAAPATDFLEGLTLLANMRMCANVPGQHAIQTALGGYQSINELIVPGGRFYEQSKLASKLLNDIPGVTCVEPQGALYCFPRLDPEVYPIVDDQQFVIDLLRSKKILVTHGTGFNWFEPDHFRLGHAAGGSGPRGGHRPDRELPRVVRLARRGRRGHGEDDRADDQEDGQGQEHGPDDPEHLAGHGDAAVVVLPRVLVDLGDHLVAVVPAERSEDRQPEDREQPEHEGQRRLRVLDGGSGLVEADLVGRALTVRLLLPVRLLLRGGYACWYGGPYAGCP